MARYQYIPAFEFYLRKAVMEVASKENIEVINYFIVEDHGNSKVVQIDEKSFVKSLIVQMTFSDDNKLIEWEVLRVKWWNV